MHLIVEKISKIWFYYHCMHIKLLSDNRIFEFSHKLIHIIQFLIVLIVLTDKNLTSICLQFFEHYVSFKNFWYIQSDSWKLFWEIRVVYLFIHCCFWKFVNWESFLQDCGWWLSELCICFGLWKKFCGNLLVGSGC